MTAGVGLHGEDGHRSAGGAALLSDANRRPLYYDTAAYVKQGQHAQLG